MEEILDIEELNEEIVDENLKDFMKKDEETEKLLSDKINELLKEEEKLTKKEEELKSLEESSREKISTNASADELIEIAGKIKEVEEELLSITENIKTLKEEKEELTTTKLDIEKSKKDYVKSLKSASSNYDNQLKKISEAIEVCDNPALKQALEDVQSKRTTELSEIEEKRVSVLRSILKEEEPEKENIEPEEDEKTKIEIPEIVSEPVKDEVEIPEIVSEPIKDELSDVVLTAEDDTQPTTQNILNIEPSIVTPDEIEIPTIETPQVQETQSSSYQPKSLDDLLLGGNVVEEVKPAFEEPTNNSNIVGLDSIFETPNNDINTLQNDELVIQETSTMVNDNKTRILYEKDVQNNLLKDIYSSSKIMPSLYNYLEGSFN